MAVNVAGASHRLMPGAAPAAEIPSGGYTCPHTGETCPAIALLLGPLKPPGEGAEAWLRTIAPCTHCRVDAAAGRDKLRHMRLGQREREILLAAARGVYVLTEAGMTRSLSAARRRAALSLGRAGLVVSAAASKQAEGAGSGQPARAAVTLTPLGRYVMTAFGRYLEAGKPVRWTRPARGATLPGRDPGELAEEALLLTRAALQATLSDLKGVLVAVIARPTKDASQLDAVMRHLESKATGLKAVLEAVGNAASAGGR